MVLYYGDAGSHWTPIRKGLFLSKKKVEVSNHCKVAGNTDGRKTHVVILERETISRLCNRPAASVFQNTFGEPSKLQTQLVNTWYLRVTTLAETELMDLNINKGPKTRTMPIPVQQHWTRTVWNTEKSVEEEGQAGPWQRLLCKRWLVVPARPWGGTCEFISEPTSYRWKPAVSCHCLLLWALLRSPLITTPQEKSRGVTWGGLHHIILKIWFKILKIWLKIWFIKFVRQISSPPHPFPAGPSMGPSFPMILPQSSSEPNSHLLPSLLDVFYLL